MKLNVFVYRATKLEKEALFRRVEDAVQQNDYSLRMTFGSRSTIRARCIRREKSPLWREGSPLRRFRHVFDEAIEDV